MSFIRLRRAGAFLSGLLMIVCGCLGTIASLAAQEAAVEAITQSTRDLPVARAWIQRTAPPGLTNIFYSHVTNAVSHLQNGDHLVFTGTHSLPAGFARWNNDAALAGFKLVGLTNVVIEGSNDAELAALAHGDLIWIQETDRLTFRNFTIRGPGMHPGLSNIWGALQFRTNNSNFTVDGLTIRNWGSQGVNSKQDLRGMNRIVNSRFEFLGQTNHPSLGTDGAAISGTFGSGGLLVANNTFFHVARAVEFQSSDHRGTSHALVEGNVAVEVVQHFASVIPNGTGLHAHLSFRNNQVSGHPHPPGVGSRGGFVIHGGQHITIDGNDVRGFSRRARGGILMSSLFADLLAPTVINNRVTDQAGFGIALARWGDHDLSRGWVVNNQVRQAGGQGFLLSGDHHVASGNQAEQNGGSGFEVRVESGTTRQIQLANNIARSNGGHGLRIFPTAADTLIRDNVLSPNANGSLLDEGANTFVASWLDPERRRTGQGTSTSGADLEVNGEVRARVFTPTSDREAKEGFQPVDVEDVLERLLGLPITQWKFKGHPAVHLGPVAQDFQAAFGLGDNAAAISTVDADGVALSAIQGLNLKLESLAREQALQIQQLETENAFLLQRLEAIEKRLPD